MYEIGIPEIICSERYEDTEHLSIKYKASSAIRPQFCDNPECTCKKMPHVHSTRKNTIRDIRSEGKLVFIELSIKRYRCPECGNIMPDKFSFYNKNSHITYRLRDEFVRRCINGETYSYIARDYGVDHKTVAAAFMEYAQSHPELTNNNYTPVILGIDEAHIDDQYRLVLTDILGKRLLDMKENRKKPTVKRFLRGLDKDICKCVAMDLAPVYAACVSEVLPDASIVVDKFHVIQEVNRCLDRVRIDIQNVYKKQGVDIRRFKNAKRLFMTNFEDLTPEGEDVLSSWFDEFDELYEAYMCKETLRDIYRLAESKEEAEQYFDMWILSVPDYKQFNAMKNTFSERKEHILNYWDYPVTNAYTESVNNLIKTLEKAGRGYKFEVLRLRCLLSINKPAEQKFDHKNAVYIPVPNSMPMVSDSTMEYRISKKTLYGNQAKDTAVLDLHEKDLFKSYISVHAKSAIKRFEAYREILSHLCKQKAGD